MVFVAAELFRDHPCTEDSRKLVLELLDRIKGERNEEWMRDRKDYPRGRTL